MYRCLQSHIKINPLLSDVPWGVAGICQDPLDLFGDLLTCDDWASFFWAHCKSHNVFFNI